MGCLNCPSCRLQLPNKYLGNRTYHYCFELGRTKEVPDTGCREDCPLKEGIRAYQLRRKKGGKNGND